MGTKLGYAKNRAPKTTFRMIVEIEQSLLDEVDKWGAETGKVSRRETVETLLKAGLAAQKDTE